MDKNALMHKRNKTILQFLWIINILDYLFYIFNEYDYKIVWPPIGIIITLILTLLYACRIPPLALMYFILSGVFAYTFYLNMVSPHIINYIFLYAGLIVSAFYLSIPLLLICGAVSLFLIAVVYMIMGDAIFASRGHEDLPYFLLFGLFIAALLYILLRFTIELWNKALEGERRAKDDLRSTKSYFESLFTYSRDAICILDKNGRILEGNMAFTDLFSKPAGELHLKRFTDLFDYQEPFSFPELVKRLKSGESPEELELMPARNSSGQKVIAEAAFSPIYGEHNKLIAVSAIIRDLTENRQIEDYMKNSEKLKITGEIAAGVAHEIRNPLTVIGGFVQMLLEEDSSRQHYYMIIQKEISRMNSIISEFLMLSKPHAANMKIHDIKELIQEIVVLYQPEAHFKNVDIILDLPREEYFILCEGNQMKQVFINILKNSFEALTCGGFIKISVQKDKHIHIVIEDNGDGIPDQILSQIGKPFFTTKEEGTGLGLMITERIIEQHKGTLKISSRVEEGTRLTITLPSAPNPSE
ncbi:ATP-binding protein [Peribacillus sp. SCS-26]|uniref:ATP-binding protein n=1 Tax=Paraperibacillus marinus TaxID=3115295 RepID=UPI003905763B